MNGSFQVIDSHGGHPAADLPWDVRIARLRGILQARGVAPGGRVLAWLPRGWEEAALWQAAVELGGVWVSVPRRHQPDQVAALAADADPVIAICGKGEKRRLGNGPWIEWPDLTASQPGAIPPPDGSAPSGLAALCYTSGSTGHPKGVMVSHENLEGALTRLEGYLRHSPADRLLSLMPLSSPWGLLQWMMARRAGAAIVLPPVVAMASELVRAIREARVTGLAALPPTWVQVVDYLFSRQETLPGLRYVTTSGGAVPRRILELFPSVFPNAEIWMTYGLTEAFRTTVLPPAEFALRMGSLGKPCPGVGIEILKPDGTRAAAGETGELVHLGDCVTLGYWRRPEATRLSFGVRPGHEAILGDTPAHYSGDRVRRDAEGFLWFEGRDDDLIKTGGYRVSSAEVEEALLAIPGVVHAVVGGVADEALGQRISAALELEPATDEGAVSRIRTALRRSLASHQQPHQIHAWPGRMPVNANGKLNRVEILAWLGRMDAGEA